jgi:hypothetical protein
MHNEFKVWDQGNDGSTMGIRVKDASELNRLSHRVTGIDLAGGYRNLAAYVKAAGTAKKPPQPYSRLVTVVWLNAMGYPNPIVFPGRTFVVTYTGNIRQSGGFAAQGYVIVDPAGFANLGVHHRDPVNVVYITSAGMDTLVVMP